MDLSHFRKTTWAFAGTHIIADFWGVKLTDCEELEHALREAAIAADAEVLKVWSHSFGQGQGITAIAVLAESHISVHSWAEANFAAFDVFMCGKADPEKAIQLLVDRFRPSSFEVERYLRGEVDIS